MRRRIPNPLMIFALAGVFAAMLVLVLVWNPSVIRPDDFIFLPDPAHPLASAVQVENRPAAKGKGGIYWVDVIERRSNWIDHLFPPSGSSFVEPERLLPPGVTNEELRQSNAELMAQSERIAKLVAVKSAGYKVGASAVVFVESIENGGPSEGKLAAGDQIVAIDGKPVSDATSLRARIHSRPAGSRLRVTVVRGTAGRRLTVRVRTIPGPEQHGAPIIGIRTQSAVAIHLPRSLRIKIDMGSVGGPSAGLGLALEIYRALGHDVAHGFKVAVTGTMEVDGHVGAIGGVKQKTIGARRAHVDVFLVPAGDNAKEARRYAGGMRIIPVTTFQQALRALATLPRKR